MAVQNALRGSREKIVENVLRGSREMVARYAL